jgi:hypothetical protein
MRFAIETPDTKPRRQQILLVLVSALLVGCYSNDFPSRVVGPGIRVPSPTPGPEQLDYREGLTSDADQTSRSSHARSGVWWIQPLKTTFTKIC